MTNKKPPAATEGDEEVMEGRNPVSIPQVEPTDDHVLIGLRLGNWIWHIANSNLPKPKGAK